MPAMPSASEPTSAAVLPAVVEFVEPIPGFPDDREFAFAAVEDTGVLYTLRSARNPGLRFIVADPAAFFPDYAPALADADLICLDADEQEELALLVIVTLTDRLADATANLLAPIVLAPRRGTAAQVLLRDAGLSLRAPLLRPAS